MTGTPDTLTPPASRTSTVPRRLALVGTVGVLIALAAVFGLIAGTRLTTSTSDFPGENSVDAGFARDMGVHHSQAVEMSVLARDRSDDQELRSIALDIILTQQQQAGQMYAWLELWELPQASMQRPMTWMQDHSDPQAHGAEAAHMPGMATAEDLNRLAAAAGPQAERLYLDLMVVHHEGGIEMAQYAANGAQTPAVKKLAVSIVNSQSAELNVLNDLLAARGGPRPD